MECSELTERVVDRLTGQLDEAARRGLEQHLSDCAACREDALQCERAWSELSQDPVGAHLGGRGAARGRGGDGAAPGKSEGAGCRDEDGRCFRGETGRHPDQAL